MAPPSPQQRQSDDKEEEEEELQWDRLLCSYTGLAFSIFLALLPTSLISSFQFQIRILSSKLLKMEETIREMKLRRAEDAKANAKVVEIFASHRIGWRQEERRLRQQIEDSGGEIVFLRDRISELETNETELRAAVDKLQREIEDREDFIDFLSRKAVGEDVSVPNSKETATPAERRGGFVGTEEIKVFDNDEWKNTNFYREREIPVKNSEIREDLLRRERIRMGAWRSMLDRGNFDAYPAGEMVPDFSTHASMNRQGMVALDRGISVSYFADLSGNGRSMVAEEELRSSSFDEKDEILSRNLFFNSHDQRVETEASLSTESMISSPNPCSTIRSCESNFASDFYRRSAEIRASDVAEYEILPSLRGSLGMSSRITTRKTRSDSLSEESLNPVTVHCGKEERVIRPNDPVPESISLFLLNDYPIYSPCRDETLLTILPESENPASNSFSGICSPGIGFPAKNLINGDMETFNYDLIEKPSLKDLKPPESSDSIKRMKSFAARKEKEQALSWKVVVDHGGGHESLMAAPSSKMKFLEKELLNLERVAIGQKGELAKIPTLMRKQAKKYQLLCAEIDNLYRRMQEENDPISERSMISPPPDQFSAQRQSEFLLQAMCLQQRAAEASQSLSAIQSEMSNRGGQLLNVIIKSSAATSAELDSRRSLESIKNNLREIQRSLEIWLARIMGGIEGILARRDHAASVPR